MNSEEMYQHTGPAGILYVGKESRRPGNLCSEVQQHNTILAVFPECVQSQSYMSMSILLRARPVVFNIYTRSQFGFLLQLLFGQAEEPCTHCCIITATRSVFEGSRFLDIPQGGGRARPTRLGKSTKLFF